MKRRRYLLLAVLVCCLVAALWLFGKRQSSILPAQEAPSVPSRMANLSSPSPPPPNPTLPKPIPQEIRWEPMFLNAVNFYGKVVDEEASPIDGASVKYSVPSNLAQIGKGTVQGPNTDSNGLFSITGKIGAGITVFVSHPNYYSSDQSSGQFSYYGNTDRNPTVSKPAVFVMRKKGTAEPLVKLKQVLKSVPTDGRSVQVGVTGNSVGDLTVQAWTSPRPAGAANNAPFDWKVRVEVPGGGLVAYEDAYQFEAPQEGYAPSVEFAMPAGGINGKWRDRFAETYFVKLGNGNFARMRFQMIAGGNHFAVVESYYNPKPGSRNLEFDPKQQVKSP